MINQYTYDLSILLNDAIEKAESAGMKKPFEILIETKEDAPLELLITIDDKVGPVH